MRTEITEVEEPFSSGKSAPHHHAAQTAIRGLEGLARPDAAVVAQRITDLSVDAREHERDAMSWRAEWLALPEISIYLSARLQNAQSILSGLTVNKARML